MQKSPLRFPGGKSRALKVLAAHFPKFIDEYREPFLGGGSVALMVSRMHPEASVWVNDIFEPAICFWRGLQDPVLSAKVIERLLHLHAETTTGLKANKALAAAASEMRDATRTELDRACAFYLYNRLSFSGASWTLSCSAENFQRFRGAKQRIRDLSIWTPVLRNWRITCGDYAQVMASPWSGKSPFQFLDPPYNVGADYLYGHEGDAHRGFDHVRFQEIAESADVPTVVTYNDGMFDRFDAWPTRKRWKLNYSMVSNPGYRRLQKSRRELLAANYSSASLKQEIFSGSAQHPAMLPDELRFTIKSLGLTQLGIAQALGVTDRTVRHWLSGRGQIPAATAMAVKALRGKKKPIEPPRLRRKKYESQLLDEGRVRLFHGDSRDVLRTMPSDSFDSVVCDPPYGLGFLERAWDTPDSVAFDRAIWKEVSRVLKPGGHLVAMGAPRTSHRMVCAIEDAGFEIRDSLIWLHSQGMPKGRGGDAASNLKPSHEPICLARKPLAEGSLAANARRWGTGPLNVNADRIEAPDQEQFARNWDRPHIHDMAGGTYMGASQAKIPNAYSAPEGRWPTNVVHDGSAELMAELPGADRFFYCAKASAKERAGSAHPTVKPIALMEWLVMLVTPAGGSFLDPFAGSGTTGQAAVNKGFFATLIEREEEYVKDIVRRFVTQTIAGREAAE